MENHLWMFNKYHYGECRPQDGIILLFLVVSLSIIGNFLVLYLNDQTWDPTRSLSLPTIVLAWSQLMNIVVFILSWCFQSFLRNIRMKEKDHTNTSVLKSQPERMYDYGDRLLHRIFVNIGLHRCPEMVSENVNNSLELKEGRPTTPEKSRQSYNIFSLMSDWQSKLRDVVNCNVCRMTEHFGVINKGKSCPFLFSSPKFTNLNTASMAILMGDDHCFPFEFATDLYYESYRFSLNEDNSMKAAMEFVDSLICLLKLLRIHYLDDYELKDISDIFNMYRSFAYYLMHHHVHKLLTFRNRMNTAFESSGITETYSKSNKTKQLSLNAKNLVSNLSQSSLPSTSQSISSADIGFKICAEKDSKMDSQNTTPKNKSDSKDLDDTLNFIIDYIVLMPLEDNISNLHEMKVNMDRIEMIYAFAEKLLINCVWRDAFCTSYEDSDNIDMSSLGQINQTRIVEKHIVIQHLLNNFQAFEDLCEIVIEKAIDNLEDDIFSYLLDEVSKESLFEPPTFCLESPAAYLTNNAIAQAKKELSAERRYPIFSFSRIAFFVTVAKHLNMRTDLIERCPELVGFLEVSQTDLDNSENLIVSLIEIIVYDLSHSKDMKEQNLSKQCLDKSFMGNICVKVLTRTQDGVSALTRDFVMSIIDYEKRYHALNLTKMYVSASLDRYSELQQNFITSCIRELLQRWEFSSWYNKGPSYLVKIFSRKKVPKTTTPTREEIQISIESGTAKDFKYTTFSSRNLFDVKGQELGLPNGYLSILYSLTYRVWLREDRSAISDGFLWQLYLDYFRNHKKPFPHWTKRIIHILMVTLIMASFISFPFCESLLRGSPMKEWALLLILSFLVNVIILEPLKVAAI